MPLQHQYNSMSDQPLDFYSLMGLINILETEEMRALRHTQTTEIKRLINVYPATQQLFRPRLIRRIMSFYWKSPFSIAMLGYMEKFEKYLLSLGKREHFIHQFEVMLIGLNLLHLFRSRISNLSTGYNFGFNDWQEIYYTWSLAAMGHDFGYPYEVASEMLEQIAGLYDNVHMEKLAGLIHGILKQPNLSKEFDLLKFIPKTNNSKLTKTFFDIQYFIKTVIKEDLNIDESEINKFENKLIFGANVSYCGPFKPSHGYVSSLILCHTILNNYFSGPGEKLIDDFIDSPSYKMLRYAASAICTHNLVAPENKKINFQNNPYSFILYILDKLHDWNRTIFEDPKWPIYYLVGFEKNENSIILKYHLYDQQWNSEMVERVKKALEEKKDELQSINNGPNPSLSLQIVINYTFSANEHKMPQDYKIVIRL